MIVPVANGAQQLINVVRDLDAAQVPLDDLALRRPTLDDVFLTLTGHATTEGKATEEAPQPALRSNR